MYECKKKVCFSSFSFGECTRFNKSPPMFPTKPSFVSATGCVFVCHFRSIFKNPELLLMKMHLFNNLRGNEAASKYDFTKCEGLKSISIILDDYNPELIKFKGVPLSVLLNRANSIGYSCVRKILKDSAFSQASVNMLAAQYGQQVSAAFHKRYPGLG